MAGAPCPQRSSHRSTATALSFREACACRHDQCLSKTLRMLLGKQRPLSFTVAWRGETKSCESQAGVYELHVVHRAGQHILSLGHADHCLPCSAPTAAPRDHTSGSPFSSQGLRDSQMWGGAQAWCLGPEMLFYCDVVIRPFGSHFSYLHKICIEDPGSLSHRE